MRKKDSEKVTQLKKDFSFNKALFQAGFAVLTAGALIFGSGSSDKKHGNEAEALGIGIIVGVVGAAAAKAGSTAMEENKADIAYEQSGFYKNQFRSDTPGA